MRKMLHRNTEKTEGPKTTKIRKARVKTVIDRKQKVKKVFLLPAFKIHQSEASTLKVYKLYGHLDTIVPLRKY